MHCQVILDNIIGKLGKQSIDEYRDAVVVLSEFKNKINMLSMRTIAISERMRNSWLAGLLKNTASNVPRKWLKLLKSFFESTRTLI